MPSKVRRSHSYLDSWFSYHVPICLCIILLASDYTQTTFYNIYIYIWAYRVDLLYSNILKSIGRGRNVRVWTSTINRTMPEVRTKWVKLQLNGEYIYIWLKSISMTNSKFSWWNGGETETSRRAGYWRNSESVSNCTLQQTCHSRK